MVAIVRPTQTQSHSHGGLFTCIEEETILQSKTRTILNQGRCDWVGLRGEFHLPPVKRLQLARSGGGASLGTL